MERYEKESYLKREIINQSRHLFIYGYQTEQRERFARDLEKENPIRMDSEDPMAIYLEDFALKKEKYDKKLDNHKIELICDSYLQFCIGHRLVQKTRQDVNIEELSSRIKKLLERIDRYSKNPDFPMIETVEDLERILEASKKFYKRYYEAYIHGEETPDIKELAIPFLLLENFVEDWKKVLKNDFYLCVLIEKKEPIDVRLTRAINFLVGGRINKNISMKIITDPNDWESYRDINGQAIEYIHDYGIVELDDSNKEYIKEIKKGW